MNILYTCDNNYIWLMGISVISLFENNKLMKNLMVYLLGENISEDNKQILRKISKKYEREIIIIDVPKIDIPETLVTTRWPLSAFTRLYAGQLLPVEVKKVLYLDCDTIIVNSIAELEGFDISKAIVYGVKDCISKSYKKNIGLEANDLYVNAGVLLLNLEKLRKVNIKETINNFMNKYEYLINYADQDILNGIFSDEIGILDPKFDVMTIDVVYTHNEIMSLRKPSNFYSESELRKAVSSPVIIHYTTNMKVVRPWYSNANHPLTTEFRKYLQISPWKDKKLNVMSFTAKEAKIIGLIMKLPDFIAHYILGLIHSDIKPFVIRFMANRRK